MGFEEEIKLTAPSKMVLDSVAEDPVLLALARGGSLLHRPFLAVYYDTHDHLLLRHGLAFRLRHGDGTLQAGLKGAGGVVLGVSRRLEWEQQLSGSINRFGQLPPGEIRDQILSIIHPDSELVSLLETDFQRRSLLLSLEGGQVELALDQGIIRANRKSVTLFEVELECIKGSFEPVKRLAAKLQQRHDLIPSVHSKFGLGLILLGSSMRRFQEGI